jgi:hypothetical protein
MKRLLIVLVLVSLFGGRVFTQDKALSAIGALGASYMYTSYLSI